MILDILFVIIKVFGIFYGLGLLIIDFEIRMCVGDMIFRIISSVGRGR